MTNQQFADKDADFQSYIAKRLAEVRRDICPYMPCDGTKYYDALLNADVCNPYAEYGRCALARFICEFGGVE